MVSFDGDVTAFLYLWRRGNVAASVFSTDKLGDLDQHGTLELARKLDARGAG